MRNRIRALGRAAAAVLAGTLLQGCCMVAHVLCPMSPPASPARLTRDTPEEAVEFLVEAMQSRRIKELFESLDPRLVEDLGGFSEQEFATAFRQYEDDFRDDAERLAGAELSPVGYQGDVAVLMLRSGDAGITLWFRNAPATVVKLHDDFFYRTRVPGTFDPAASLSVSGETLRVAAELPLHGGGVDRSAVKRIEFHHDWLLAGWEDARGIRFLDRLKDEAEAQTR